MENVVPLEKWLKRGRQRSAVLQVLRKPMPSSEILKAAKIINPHLQLRDLWLVLPQFIHRGIAVCLTPRQDNGRLYALTPLGRRFVKHAYGIDTASHPKEVDWRRYAWVVRAKVRRATLTGLVTLFERAPKPRTATEIRKAVREESPVGLNPVLRSLKELVARSLVRVTATAGNHHRQYAPTPAGRRIASQLHR